MADLVTRQQSLFEETVHRRLECVAGLPALAPQIMVNRLDLGRSALPEILQNGDLKRA